MNNTITANELKTKGISAAEENAREGLETVVTVRGEEKYVILSKEDFNRLREYELTVALMEAEWDLKNGNFHEDSIEDHLKRLK